MPLQFQLDIRIFASTLYEFPIGHHQFHFAIILHSKVNISATFMLKEIMRTSESNKIEKEILQFSLEPHCIRCG